jgi:hypothetical protein
MKERYAYLRNSPFSVLRSRFFIGLPPGQWLCGITWSVFHPWLIAEFG